MHINIIGPIPPPMGGISIHIQRMKRILSQQQIPCRLYNECAWERQSDDIYAIGSYKRFMLKIPFLQGDLFHFHTIHKRFRMLLGFYSWFGKKIVLTVHGGSLQQQLSQSNRLERYLLLQSLRRIRSIVCVNESDALELIALGLSPNQVKAIPAYIHPSASRADEEAISDELWRFINNQSFVIAANGFVRFHEGEDLYGIDLLLNAVRQLKEQQANAAVVFALLGCAEQTAEERDYYKSLQARIKEYGLEANWLFYEVKDTELYPILQHSHLFIRPTRADGYGVSIAEALHAGIPSLASDVCRRPDGAVTFQSGSSRDLYDKLSEIVHHYDAYKAKVTELAVRDYSSDLMEVYREVIRS